MDIHKITLNQLNYKTFRELELAGKTWLVVNGVPIVEGVLNKFLVPYEEFAAFPADWNDTPLVLNHPKENGGSARVASPDVPVIGRFHNTTVDATGRRLTGEFWLDKIAFLATQQGADLYAKMLKGQPIEVSTGYFAPQTSFENGKFGGTDYTGIHKGIHPDHIAILTNEAGACSLYDGCGMNRNAEGVVLNCGNAKDCTRADCPMKGKKQGQQDMNQQSADPSLDWSAQIKSVLSKEYLMQNATLKAFLHSLGFKDVSIEDAGADGLSVALTGTGDDKALEGLVQLNTLVQNSGGADAFVKTFESLKGLPATMAALQTQMNENLVLVKNASTFAASVAAKEAARKGVLVAGLVQNKANPFDEATLNAMSLDVLEKLEGSYQPVDFSGLGISFMNSANAGADKPLVLPAMYLAKPENKEA
jgi:hypothetical protein